MSVDTIAPSTAALHEQARQAYRQSVAEGAALTDVELGAAFQRSPRWARDRIAEVRADLAPPAEPEPAEPVEVDQVEPPATVPAEPEPVAETIMPPVPTEPDRVDVGQLIRLRWAVRAVLTLGVAASVAGNVLHAEPHPVSQAIAAWPPLALLLTVELISRVPVHRRGLATVRWLATATIAGIAAWVSYWHLVGVAARYGETGTSPYLLPLSIDGLIVVASICLLELGGRIGARPDRQGALR